MAGKWFAMSTGQDRSTTARRESSPLLLLVSLLFALLVAPVIGQVVGGPVFVCVGITAVLAFGVFVVRWRSHLFLPCLALAVLAVATTWVRLFTPHPLLFVASCLLVASFYATIACVLVVRIVKKHLASVQSIFGAVCVYLLFGLSWTQLYWASVRIDPESLTFAQSAMSEEESHPELTVPFSRVVYFSFVTMSTLGYGDIVPKTPLAQTLTWMQSVLGQFFLAVLVAWLVSAIPRGRSPAGKPLSEAEKERNE